MSPEKQRLKPSNSPRVQGLKSPRSSGANDRPGLLVVDSDTHELTRRTTVFDYEDRHAGFTRLLARDSLVFQSHFESGNLMRAERVPVERAQGWWRRA